MNLNRKNAVVEQAAGLPPLADLSYFKMNLLWVGLNESVSSPLTEGIPFTSSLKERGAKPYTVEACTCSRQSVLNPTAVVYIDYSQTMEINLADVLEPLGLSMRRCVQLKCVFCQFVHFKMIAN